MKKFKAGEKVIWKSQPWNKPQEGFYSHPDSTHEWHYISENKYLTGRLYIVGDTLIEPMPK